MNRGHRVRLYPTSEQARRMTQWIGTAGFLWNLARDQRLWYRDVGKVRQCLDLTELRRAVDWIADLPAQTAQEVLADLDLAWQRCWAGLGRPPTLKRKGHPVGLRFPQGVEVRRLNRRWGAVRLPKLGEVRFRWTRDLPGQVRSAKVSCASEQWHLALCLEMGDRAVEPNGLSPVGVDRGVEVAFMTSEGESDREMWNPAARGTDAAARLGTTQGSPGQGLDRSISPTGYRLRRRPG